LAIFPEPERLESFEFFCPRDGAMLQLGLCEVGDLGIAELEAEPGSEVQILRFLDSVGIAAWQPRCSWSLMLALRAKIGFGARISD
jgi:hypothetical protein